MAVPTPVLKLPKCQYPIPTIDTIRITFAPMAKILGIKALSAGGWA